MKIRCVVVIVVLLFSQGFYDESESQEVISEDIPAPEEAALPALEILPDVSSGRAPLTVTFDGVVSTDEKISLLEWDFQGDGIFEERKELASLEKEKQFPALKEALKKSHTYTQPGIYHVLLRATNEQEKSVTASVTIQVYSERPWLDITPGRDAYMARAGYEAFFPTHLTSDTGISFELDGCSITYSLPDQYFAPLSKTEGIPRGQKIVYENVYPGVHVQYTVSEDLLLEEFIVSTPMPIASVEQHFTMSGVEYRMEDSAILFYRGEDLIFSIPRPIMYELRNPQEKSYGLHYEIVEDNNCYILKKVIDDDTWLKSAEYPVVIDSTTQGEIADPWEQQGLTPYGQYFKNVSEYVDPLTGHLTIRHTDYSLSGRGLDLTITRVYSTVVAYKQDESGSGAYIPVATYQEAPTDLGCGWRLDFPWMEVTDSGPGPYYHVTNAAQVKTNFSNGVWNNEAYGFTIYANQDKTFTKYQKNGIKEEYDDKGRLVSMSDLHNNIITFSYGQHGISSITDTVGRTVTFTYSADKLTSISDGHRTTLYTYSGDKLIS
ncbi:MAG: PKD domain-containing protein, partial [Theionarchaea archaeon]|nr:PKD domain-containing protein [Theionarchaea archaeon]